MTETGNCQTTWIDQISAARLQLYFSVKDLFRNDLQSEHTYANIRHRIQSSFPYFLHNKGILRRMDQTNSGKGCTARYGCRHIWQGMDFRYLGTIQRTGGFSIRRSYLSFCGSFLYVNMVSDCHPHPKS